MRHYIESYPKVLVSTSIMLSRNPSVDPPPILAICVPSRGERLTCIREQVSEFAAAKQILGGQIEFCLSINGPIDEEDLQGLRSCGVNAFRDISAATANQNIISVMSSARAQHALLLGDDDLIKASSLVSLARWLQSTELNFPVVTLPLVHGSAKQHIAPIVSERTLTPSQSLMRFAALPGIVISPSAAKSKSFLDWHELNPYALYPQIAMCQMQLQRGSAYRISSDIAAVNVGEGNGLISSYANRLPDYGCRERLVQAQIFLSGGFRRRLEFWRFQANLALWIASSLQPRGALEEEFVRNIVSGIFQNCGKFRIFTILFRIRKSFKFDSQRKIPS